MFVVHTTGKRPIVFTSLIGCGLCFLGTATYARYLNLVPGVSVSNVVANASLADLGNTTFLINDQTANETLNDLIANNQTFDIEEFSSSREIPTTTEISLINEFTNIAIRVKRNGTLDHNATSVEHAHAKHILTNWAERANHTKLDQSHGVLLDVPGTEDNEILWLPLTLLLLSALLAHMGIRIIPWMLIGEVIYFIKLKFIHIFSSTKYFILGFSSRMSKRCIRFCQWNWLHFWVFGQ